jgi:apolipoprotein D and lipocalin family protein
MASFQLVVVVVIVVVLVLGAIVLAGMWNDDWSSSAAAQATDSEKEIQPVAVDLNLYQGKWYEQMRIPSWFEPATMRGATAEYKWNPETQQMSVINRGQLDGKMYEASGQARPDASGKPGRLSVTFDQGPPGAEPGSYLVLAKDCSSRGDRPYECAVVGSKDRRQLWLLTRNPTDRSPELEAYAKDVARRNGYSEEMLRSFIPTPS